MQKMQISIKKGKKKAGLWLTFFSRVSFVRDTSSTRIQTLYIFLLKLRTNVCESGVSIGQPIMNSLDVLMIFKLAQTFAYAKIFLRIPLGVYNLAFVCGFGQRLDGLYLMTSRYFAAC